MQCPVCDVTLVISETAWLERLLLRLGTDAQVLEGAEEVARRAANRLLARYGVAPLAG